jgi:hypothetical protein
MCLIGTPASIKAKVLPHVEAIEVEPLEDIISETKRMVHRSNIITSKIRLAIPGKITVNLHLSSKKRIMPNLSYFGIIEISGENNQVM